MHGQMDSSPATEDCCTMCYAHIQKSAASTDNPAGRVEVQKHCVVPTGQRFAPPHFCNWTVQAVPPLTVPCSSPSVRVSVSCEHSASRPATACVQMLQAGDAASVTANGKPSWPWGLRCNLQLKFSPLTAIPCSENPGSTVHNTPSRPISTVQSQTLGGLFTCMLGVYFCQTDNAPHARRGASVPLTAAK